MIATASMNGVIKIVKRSLVQFQFGDDEPITLDVVAVADQWHEVSYPLRVIENDYWIVPANKVNEFAVNRLNFVQAIINDAYAELGKPAPTLTRIEAEEFIIQVQEATKNLRNFILPKAEETSSAPESTDRGVNFSQ